MWDWIEKQQNKSRPKRMRLTLALTTTLTAVIVLVWGTVVLPRSLNLNNPDKNVANSSSPFGVLMESINVMTEDAKKGFGSIQEVFDNKPEEGEEESLAPKESEESEMPSTGSRGEIEAVGEFEFDPSVDIDESEPSEPVADSLTEPKNIGVETEGEVTEEHLTEEVSSPEHTPFKRWLDMLK